MSKIIRLVAFILVVSFNLLTISLAKAQDGAIIKSPPGE